jgi:hypothetical protein
MIAPFTFTRDEKLVMPLAVSVGGASLMVMPGQTDIAGSKPPYADGTPEVGTVAEIGVGGGACAVVGAVAIAALAGASGVGVGDGV